MSDTIKAGDRVLLTLGPNRGPFVVVNAWANGFGYETKTGAGWVSVTNESVVKLADLNGDLVKTSCLPTAIRYANNDGIVKAQFVVLETQLPPPYPLPLSLWEEHGSTIMRLAAYAACLACSAALLVQGLLALRAGR